MPLGDNGHDSDSGFTPKIVSKLWILGSQPPRLDARQWLSLALLQAAGYFGSYDRTIFGVAVPQIQQSFNASDSHMHYSASIIGLSSVLACILACASDKYGRARVLMWTLIPYTLATAATAASKGLISLTICQFMAQASITAEGLISHVLILEEMPAVRRGWAIGVLNVGSACGAGLALLLFGLSNGAWRLMYALSILPLLGVGYFRRLLPESRCWASQADVKHESGLNEVLTQMGSPQANFQLEAGKMELAHAGTSALRGHPRPKLEYAAMVVSAFFGSFSSSAANFLASKHVQVTHGFGAGGFAKLSIIGGGMSLFVFVLAGTLGDQYGRKAIGIVGLLLKMVVDMAFYSVGAEGHLASTAIVALFSLRTALSMGLETNFQVLAGEVFPTSMRTSAQGVLALTVGGGGSLGLLVEAHLTDHLGESVSHTETARAMLLGQLLTAAVIFFGIPETRGRDLEEIHESD
mmetsp:Transcript_66741/g.118068  ORF Transcript_66741/g.118068 Transcript_66741/m.118068 type:complete len:467 (+) Transcript_66741:67-1467(+)